MELGALRTLVALSELGSISLAGEQLHLSAGAIHKRLKLMEAELGVRLYERVGRRLQLTQAADVLLPHLRDMLIAYESALAALADWKGLGRGVVRIGTGPTSYILPAILKRFRRAHAGVEVLVESGNTPVLLNDLQKGALDLAFLASPDLNEARDFCIECHWDFELVLVSHAQQPPRRPHLADLRGLRFILFREGSRMQGPIDRYFAAHGFQPNVIMRFDSAEFIRSMVRTGLGVSMLPLWVIHQDVKEGRLHLIHQAEPPLCSKIALVRRKASYLPPAVQRFIATARALEPKSLPLLTERSHVPAGMPSRGAETFQRKKSGA